MLAQGKEQLLRKESTMTRERELESVDRRGRECEGRRKEKEL